MTTLLALVNWAMPLVYLALSIDYGASFFLRLKTRSRNPWLVLALAVHAAYLGLRWAALGHPPLGTNVEVLSVVALSTAVVYLVQEYAGRDRRTGIFVFLLVFLLQYSSSLMVAHRVAAPAPGVTSGWARLHILPAILAYTAVSVAAVYGLLHLVAQRNLKRRRFGPLFDRLPSLDRLGTMTWHAVLVGFVLLTVTMATAGGMMAFGGSPGGEAGWTIGPRVAARIIVGGVAWGIYLLAIIGRYALRWPAARLSAVAVNGFVAIVALFVLTAVLA